MKEAITLKDVFAISDRDSNQSGGKDRWTKIGIGFVNRDHSINIVLDALPLNGRLQVRERRPFKNQTYTKEKES